MIICCGCPQKPTELKEIESKIDNCKQYYASIEKCRKCGNPALQIITIDKQGKKTSKKIQNKNIGSFKKNNKVIEDIPLNFGFGLEKRNRIIGNTASDYSKRAASGHYKNTA